MHFENIENIKRKKRIKSYPHHPNPLLTLQFLPPLSSKKKKVLRRFILLDFFFLRQLSFVEETSLFLRERLPMTVKHIIFRYNDFTNSRAYLTLVR